jgi:hypothetical protein
MKSVAILIALNLFLLATPATQAQTSPSGQAQKASPTQQKRAEKKPLPPPPPRGPGCTLDERFIADKQTWCINGKEMQCLATGSARWVNTGRGC